MATGIESIFKDAIREKRKILLEPEAKMICQTYGLPVPEFGVARNASEAASIANKVSYPVVLKIVSPDIIHKTEAGGVALNLLSRNEVPAAYNRVTENAKKYNPSADIRGVLVQHMAPPGIEVIAGGLRDSQFGPTIMFGLGGIYVEVLKDVSFRVAPISEVDSHEMVREIRAYPILAGARGQLPADEEAVRKILEATSRIMVDNSAIEQVDLNPILVYGKGAAIVDARIIIAI